MASGASGSPESWACSHLALANSSWHPKGWLINCPCIFQLWLLPVPAVFFPTRPGEARRGELRYLAALAVECHGFWGCGTKGPSSSQHSAGRLSVLGRAERCGEGAGSAAGVAQGILPGYFLPVLLPRAGAVRFGSWEESPQGTGMIH